MRNVFQDALLVALALPLIGCGGSSGPNATDVRAALKAAALANLDANNNAFYRMFHDYTGHDNLRDAGVASALLDKPTIEVAECSAASNAGGYYCDYRISWKGVLPLPDGVTIPDWSKWYKGRFFKAGSDWNFEDQRQ